MSLASEIAKVLGEQYAKQFPLLCGAKASPGLHATSWVMWFEPIIAAKLEPTRNLLKACLKMLTDGDECIDGSSLTSAIEVWLSEEK